MTVYLIHGFGMNNSIWRKITKNIQAENIILTNLPGYDGTDEKYYDNIESLASAYKTLIKRPGIIVGHSMGGYLALQICKLFPEKIRGLMLFHSHPFADSGDKQEGRKKHISFLETHGVAKFYKEIMHNFFYNKANKEIEQLINNGNNMRVSLLVNNLQIMTSRPDMTDFLTKTNIPVGFIIGKYDNLIDGEAWFAQTAFPKKAAVYALKKSAHLGMLEEPRKSTEAINHFIETCSLL